MNGVLIAITAQNNAGIGTVIGLGVVVLIGLIALVRCTILDLIDNAKSKSNAAPYRGLARNTGFGDEWRIAVKDAKLKGDTKRLKELDKSFPFV